MRTAREVEAKALRAIDSSFGERETSPEVWGENQPSAITSRGSYHDAKAALRAEQSVAGEAFARRVGWFLVRMDEHALTSGGPFRDEKRDRGEVQRLTDELIQDIDNGAAFEWELPNQQ